MTISIVTEIKPAFRHLYFSFLFKLAVNIIFKIPINKLQVLQNLKGSIFAWLFILGCLFVGILRLSRQEQTRLSPDQTILDKARPDQTRQDLLDTMVNFPDTMVVLLDTLLDFPDTMVHLSDTMVDLPDTMVELANTMVELLDTIVELPGPWETFLTPW